MRKRYCKIDGKLITKDKSAHHFPLKDKVLCAQWKAAVGKPNFEPTQNSFVCGDHFEESWKIKVTGRKDVRGCVQLKAGAVPAIAINSLDLDNPTKSTGELITYEMETAEIKEEFTNNSSEENEQPEFLERLNYSQNFSRTDPLDDVVMNSSMNFYKREYERQKQEIADLKAWRAKTVDNDLMERLKVSHQTVIKLKKWNAEKDLQIANLKFQLGKAQQEIKENDRKWVKALEPILDEDQINELRGMK